MHASLTATVVLPVPSRVRVVGRWTVRMIAWLPPWPWYHFSRLLVLALAIQQASIPLQQLRYLALRSAELRRPPISRFECRYLLKALEVSNFVLSGQH